MHLIVTCLTAAAFSFGNDHRNLTIDTSKCNISHPILAVSGIIESITTTGSIENIVNEPLCDEKYKLGELCDAKNFICRRNPFVAICECMNGFVKDKNENATEKCYCPETMKIVGENCICPDGHTETPDGKCVKPQPHCPWLQHLQCYEGTGQADGPNCIFTCGCIEQIGGSCANSTEELKSTGHHDNIGLEYAENQCIQPGNSTKSLRLVNVGEKCGFHENFVCQKGEKEKPYCRCINGYEIQWLNGDIGCRCPEPKQEIRGHCLGDVEILPLKKSNHNGI